MCMNRILWLTIGNMVNKRKNNNKEQDENKEAKKVRE